MELVGREPETVELEAMLDRIDHHGSALLVHGEPGVGKSALLEVATQRAVIRGMRVLEASGVQSERRLPYAGLQQLLRPIIRGTEALAPAQRNLLRAALGWVPGPDPEPLHLAVAVGELLAASAARAPIVLIVDDLHWLDRPTAEVLAFLARRLGPEPVVLIAAGHERPGGPLDGAALPELRLRPLCAEAAAALLDAHAPALGAVMRSRLLSDAAGNPLALVELPAAVEEPGETAGMQPTLPLTPRLEQAFGRRLADLPAATVTALLVAAIDTGARLGEVLVGASIVTGRALTSDDLWPAISAGLVECSDTTVRFRHPLVRAAIHQRAQLADRHAAHRALATVLAADRDRVAWHRAAATLRPCEFVAAELEEMAVRATSRMDLITAARAFERAAQLSEDRPTAGRRLLDAAASALESGLPEAGRRMLRATSGIALHPRDAARLTLLEEGLCADSAPRTESVLSLLDAGERMAGIHEEDLALDLLAAAAARGFWCDREGDACSTRILAAAERLPVAPDDPRLLAIFAFTEPLERGAAVINGLGSAGAQGTGRRPADAGLLATAAALVGDVDVAAAFCAASVGRLRDQGHLMQLVRALVTRAWTGTQLGEWREATADAEEASALAWETGQPLWAAAADAGRSILAALHGDRDGSEALAVQAARTGFALHARGVLCDVQFARGLSALGAGQHADAYQQLLRMYDAADPAHHVPTCWHAIGHLAEAAAQSGNGEAARVLLDALEPLARRTPSPRLHAGLRHARALLAGDAEAEGLYEIALRADLACQPFDRARLHLAHGMWLRRQRRAAESRPALRAARDTFEALGAAAWCERARQELRASGETLRRRCDETRDDLTPQELQIAQLATEGLSNRQIGEMLFLSHRTVGSHLYRIFPKLGITSRSELRQSLDRELASAA